MRLFLLRLGLFLSKPLFMAQSCAGYLAHPFEKLVVFYERMCQVASTGHFLKLQPDVPVPATCPVNPVYAGSLGKSGLEDVPWIRADPLSSHVTAFLFFVEPTYQQTHTYQPLHTGGSYPDGSRNTKILWIVDASNAPDTATITGVKVSSPHETFQQTFSLAGSATPGANYPSIVNVPTPGCWQIQFNGAASMIFWVIGK